LAMASRIKLAGYRIGLCELPRFHENITEVLTSQTIHATGMISGRFPLALATTDIQKAVHWADMLIIVTHAAAHSELAEQCAPYLTEKHTVVLCPSYVGGAWHFMRTIERLGHNPKAGVVECSVLPYVCKKTAPDTVAVNGVKRRFIVSVAGGNLAEAGTNLMKDLFDGVEIHRHPVEAGLNETNFIIHACVALLNIGFVQGAEPWTFYRQGLTDSIGRLIEAVDSERMALLTEMKLPWTSLARWMQDFYEEQGMAGDGIYELLGTFPPFARSPGPLSFTHRYFSEDIGYGLVPMAGLADKCGVPMPLTNALIDLACQITGENYRVTGRDIYDFDPTGPTYMEESYRCSE
jgi:opine dehydrogenase